MMRIGCLIQHDSVAALFFAFFFFASVLFFACFPSGTSFFSGGKAAERLPPLNKAKNLPDQEERGALSSKSQDSFRIFEHLFILTLYFSHCFQFSSISSAMICFLLFFLNRLQ